VITALSIEGLEESVWQFLLCATKLPKAPLEYLAQAQPNSSLSLKRSAMNCRNRNFNWFVLKDGCLSWTEISTLPKDLNRRLSNDSPLRDPAINEHLHHAISLSIGPSINIRMYVT
jgi:hypothetical protein